MNLRPLQRACRPLSWGCIALLAFLSLTPAPDMVRTGLPSRWEHVIAYAGTAAITVLGRRGAGAAFNPAALLVAYAGVLEWLQRFSPGRFPELGDFFASSVGVLAGALLAALVLNLARRAGNNL